MATSAAAAPIRASSTRCDRLRTPWRREARDEYSSHRIRRTRPTLDPVNPLHCFQLDRRNFLKLFGGGLLVCLTGERALAQEAGRGFGGRQQVPNDVSAWLHIDADGKVSVFTGKVEVGQNIRTSLAQLVAEELMLPFDAITMVMGDTDLVPYDAGTFGSQTTPQMGPRLRTMAAAARQALIELAAKQWSVDAASLTIADGKVTNPAQQTIPQLRPAHARRKAGHYGLQHMRL